VCRSPTKSIVILNLTEDRESRPHQMACKMGGSGSVRLGCVRTHPDTRYISLSYIEIDNDDTRGCFRTIWLMILSTV
jgi:hypothetical protein